jgi:choline dehydrogenase-like flavoprotein
LPESFDTVVVGTGFASSFFLQEYLNHAPADARILVLEKGRKHAYTWKVENQANTDVDFDKAVINRTPAKPWIQKIGFGGGTCWTGTAPRPHPSDFEMKTRYGIGEDWPLSYDDLEPYLCEVEETMGIGGPNEGPFPRSRPYPMPAHAINGFDAAIAAKFPDEHIAMPSARASSTKTGRPQCCVNGICSNCPIGAKFQVDLHMAHVYDDERITLRLDSSVDTLDIESGRVRAVHYTHQGKGYRVGCDLAVVGAHAVFSPFILLKSGLEDRALGRYIHEQFSVPVQLNLAGLDSLDGGQQVTGLGVMFHDHGERAKRAACNVESWNVPWLRAERGRWRQRALVKFVFEDTPSYDNYVGIAPEDESKPELYYAARSQRTEAGIAYVPRLIEQLIEGLPVEDYAIEKHEGLGSSAHIQGTTRMGTDSKESVVDRNLVHHRVRNLLVLGSGAFPSCSPANPTLILSALSVWAARRLMA